MNFIRKLKNGKSQIMKDVAFCELLNGTLPSENKDINELILEFDKKIAEIDNTISEGALKNVHGDWYEWLIAIAAWNYCADHSKASLVLISPNITQFDVARLYNDKLYNLVEDLRDKVLKSSSVQLISSNPDFVIIDRKVADNVLGKIDKIEVIDREAISKIEAAIKLFKGKCDFDDIHGYISVKKSFRPDRRLQIPHEGSLMKAIYTHLQTREWIINPKGIKYFAVAAEVGKSDIEALKTVATHSITTVHSIPQAAVDAVFEVNSLQQAKVVFEKILLNV